MSTHVPSQYGNDAVTHNELYSCDVSYDGALSQQVDTRSYARSHCCYRVPLLSMQDAAMMGTRGILTSVNDKFKMVRRHRCDTAYTRCVCIPQFLYVYVLCCAAVTPQTKSVHVLPAIDM